VCVCVCVLKVDLMCSPSLLIHGDARVCAGDMSHCSTPWFRKAIYTHYIAFLKAIYTQEGNTYTPSGRRYIHAFRKAWIYTPSGRREYTRLQEGVNIHAFRKAIYTRLQEGVYIHAFRKACIYTHSGRRYIHAFRKACIYTPSGRRVYTCLPEGVYISLTCVYIAFLKAIYTYRDICIYISLIFIGHFLQKWPIFSGTFVEMICNLYTRYIYIEMWDIYTHTEIYIHTQRYIYTHRWLSRSPAPHSQSYMVAKTLRIP